MVGGIINETIFLEDKPAARRPDISRYETIEELFDLIQDAIDRNAYSLLITYAGGVAQPRMSAWNTAYPPSCCR